MERGEWWRGGSGGEGVVMERGSGGERERVGVSDKEEGESIAHNILIHKQNSTYFSTKISWLKLDPL